MNQPDVLGINVYIKRYPDGTSTRSYEARGVGETYSVFYSWLSTVAIKDERLDWSWHGWSFVDSKHEETISLLWGKFIREEDEEEDDDDELPVEISANPIAEEILNILNAEITKEIDNEIMKELFK